MNVVAVWLGKSVLALLRLLGRRGNALPGLVVEKIFPGYLARAMATLPEGVVVVTGTNGKTTTTKMVATILGRAYRVLTNDTGSNFVRGAITATVEHATLVADGCPTTSRSSSSTRRGRCGSSTSSRRGGRCCSTSCATSSTGSARSTRPPRCWARSPPRPPAHVVLNRDDERIAALARRDAGRGDATTASRPHCARCSRPTRSSTAARCTSPTSRRRPSCCACRRRRTDADACGSTTSEHDVELRAEGPHNAQNATGAAALALTFGLDARHDRRRAGARCRQPSAAVSASRRRTAGGAAAGEEPGRVPADAAHPRHHARPIRS